MLKILYNEASESNITGTISISGIFLSIEAESGGYSGGDCIESMNSYNSYVFSLSPNSLVKNFRTISESDYKFLDMNRLGVSIKMDYSDMTQLFSGSGIIQVDTGIMNGTERDIVIRVFKGKKGSFTIDADMDYEEDTFNSEDLPTQTHPRVDLWDSYEVTIDGRKFQADRKGRIISGDSEIPIVPNGDYITIDIQKCKGQFKGYLSRDVDCEDVLIDSTCGLLNARRISLKNGAGSIRLYPFGYTGPFKLKLGRKWYEVWNEYNLILGK
nr:MAG TPA: hypothetical protein [Caudoviricetes sp.]